jgi:uncharacterized protein with HEPN domain
MPGRDDAPYLEDILEAAAATQRTVRRHTFETFLAVEDAREAVLFRLVKIGEAASRLPEALRERHPEVDWRSAIGFRNRVVHGYFSVNWTIVWDTATLDLPVLERQVMDILRRTATSDPDEEDTDSTR